MVPKEGKKRIFTYKNMNMPLVLSMMNDAYF